MYYSVGVAIHVLTFLWFSLVNQSLEFCDVSLLRAQGRDSLQQFRDFSYGIKNVPNARISQVLHICKTALLLLWISRI